MYDPSISAFAEITNNLNIPFTNALSIIKDKKLDWR